MRILVVEDEPDLNNVITNELIMDGYSADHCLTGDEAVDCISCAEYDAIILDIMLPGISGLEVLKTIRNCNIKTPVLLLTARDSIEDRVTGLNKGADDYLIKPFAFDELLARIRAMIRRSTDHASNILTAADLMIDSNSREVIRGGANISLSSKEFAILEYMMLNKNVVLTREKISQHIWNFDYEGSSNVIDVHIRYLRKKIDEGFPHKLIHTVRGTGYVLREDI